MISSNITTKEWAMANIYFKENSSKVKFNLQLEERNINFIQVAGEIYALAPHGFLLGKGGFSRVKLCQNRQGENFAVKIEIGKTSPLDEELEIMTRIGYARGRALFTKYRKIIVSARKRKEIDEKTIVLRNTGTGWLANYKRDGKVKNKKIILDETMLNKLLNSPAFVTDQDIIQNINKQCALVPWVKSYTVMTLQEGRELFDEIYAPAPASPGNFVKRNCLTEIQKLKIALACCNSIEYLHNNGIIHADIKPENFMIKIKEDDIRLAVIDFNCSIQLPGYIKSETQEQAQNDEKSDHVIKYEYKGSKEYAAPEIKLTYKSLILLGESVPHPTSINAADKLILQKNQDEVTLYWTANKKLCHRTRKYTEVGEILNLLPSINKLEKIDLVHDKINLEALITAAFDCPLPEKSLDKKEVFRYSFASDIYALGCLFKKDLDLTNNVIAAMLNLMPQDRPSLKEIKLALNKQLILNYQLENILLSSFVKPIAQKSDYILMHNRTSMQSLVEEMKTELSQVLMKFKNAKSINELNEIVGEESIFLTNSTSLVHCKAQKMYEYLKMTTRVICGLTKNAKPQGTGELAKIYAECETCMQTLMDIFEIKLPLDQEVTNKPRQSVRLTGR